MLSKVKKENDFKNYPLTYLPFTFSPIKSQHRRSRAIQHFSLKIENRIKGVTVKLKLIINLQNNYIVGLFKYSYVLDL